jgi:hypothetical protein
MPPEVETFWCDNLFQLDDILMLELLQNLDLPYCCDWKLHQINKRILFYFCKIEIAAKRHKLIASRKRNTTRWLEMLQAKIIY